MISEGSIIVKLRLYILGAGRKLLKILNNLQLTWEVYRNPDGQAEQLLKETLCTVLQSLINADQDPETRFHI